MSEDDEDVDVDFTAQTPADHFSVEAGWLIFPEGIRSFCEQYEATAVHIDHDGNVWVLDSKTGKWVDAERHDASVTPIRPN